MEFSIFYLSFPTAKLSQMLPGPAPVKKGCALSKHRFKRRQRLVELGMSNQWHPPEEEVGEETGVEEEVRPDSDEEEEVVEKPVPEDVVLWEAGFVLEDDDSNEEGEEDGEKPPEIGPGWTPREAGLYDLIGPGGGLHFAKPDEVRSARGLEGRAICQQIRKVNRSSLAIKGTRLPLSYYIERGEQLTSQEFAHCLEVYENNQQFFYNYFSRKPHLRETTRKEILLTRLKGLETWFIQICEPRPRTRSERKEWLDRELTKKEGWTAYCDHELRPYARVKSKVMREVRARARRLETRCNGW